MKRLLSVLTLCSVFASCASTSLVNSIDDLTAQVDQQGFLSLQQQRILSLSGLMPMGNPGTIYRYKGSRSPFTSIGIGGEESYYVQRTIESKASQDELLELRNDLVDVRVAASDIIRIRLERLQARAQDPPDKSRISTLDSSLDVAEEKFDKAWKAVVEDVKHPGMFILRTDRTTSTDLATRIGSILGLNSKGESSTGGFAVVSGLRTSFLFLGNDLKDWPQQPKQDWNLIGTSFPFILGTRYPFQDALLPFPILGQCNYEDLHIVTSKLEAQHVLYLRDAASERRVQANFEASVEQLRNLEKTIREIDGIAIDAVLARVESLGNVGITGTAEEKRIPLYDDVTKFEFIPASTPEKWQTIYQVLSDYDDIRTLSDGRLRLHFTNFY